MVCIIGPLPEASVRVRFIRFIWVLPSTFSGLACQLSWPGFGFATLLVSDTFLHKPLCEGLDISALYID